MRTLVWVALLLLLGTACVQRAECKEPVTAAVPSALRDYVTAADESYKYQLEGVDQIDGCTVHKLALTSQTWQGIPWRHALYAYVPENPRRTDTVLLFITGGKIGGKPDEGEIAMGRQLAKTADMPVVFLHQVPNQPLLGDRVEDDLISETFLRYLETKDASWPLLFPMVKSATAAMTAIQEFAQERYNVSVERFIVTGGSKRGWTSWLTAAADDRVAAIAPIVIDTLNFGPQMQHQLDVWGEFSEQIADYTTKGLVDIMVKQPEVPMWRWVDPYTYRSKLTLPKLIINGTNDRYWAVDATSLYWDDLVGEKHLRYVPNVGHGLDEGREGALKTLTAFAQYIADRKSMPQLTWTFDENDQRLQLNMSATTKPKSVRLWTAHSGTRDFRDAKWEAVELSAASESNGDAAEYVGTVEKPASGYVAAFGEATFANGPLEFNLSTLLRQE